MGEPACPCQELGADVPDKPHSARRLAPLPSSARPSPVARTLSFFPHSHTPAALLCPSLLTTHSKHPLTVDPSRVCSGRLKADQKEFLLHACSGLSTYPVEIRVLLGQTTVHCTARASLVNFGGLSTAKRKEGSEERGSKELRIITLLPSGFVGPAALSLFYVDCLIPSSTW